MGNTTYIDGAGVGGAQEGVLGEVKEAEVLPSHSV